MTFAMLVALFFFFATLTTGAVLFILEGTKSGDGNMTAIGVLMGILGAGVLGFFFAFIAEVYGVVEYACDYSNIRDVILEQRIEFTDRPNRLDELNRLMYVTDEICGEAS